MAEGKVEFGSPEFKTWPFESFGQVLKVSGSLEPEIFPYRVSLSKDSAFFKNVYNGVYRGKMATVFGSEKGKHPVANGIIVEHMAILAANDLGEIMISKNVFQGNSSKSLTDYSMGEFIKYYRYNRSLPLPVGWRRFGHIHSHPIDDAVNTLSLALGKTPKVNNMAVSFSGADFLSLIEPISESYIQNTVVGVITPIQLAFMVATKKTCEVLKRNTNQTKDLTKESASGLPPYKNFEKLGLVLYAGNHAGFGKNIALQRLIY